MISLPDIAARYGSEAAWLVGLLRQRMTGSSIDTEIPPVAVDTQRFSDMLYSHNLTGLLHDRVPEPLLTAAQRSDLSRRVAARARLNLLSLAEMCRLQTAFDAMALRFAFVKGALLSKLLFNDFTTRLSADLDLLIDAGDFSRVRQFLLADGYAEMYPVPAGSLDYYLRFNREAAFRKKTDGGIYLHIELQWSPLPAYFPMPYGNEYFLQHRVQEQVGQQSITTLAPTQHLLQLLLHHGVGDLWRSLRHVFDIAMFLQRQGAAVNWKALQDQLANWHALRNAACGLGMAEQLFLPGAMAQWASPPAANSLQQGLDILLSQPMLPKKKLHPRNLRQQLRLMDDNASRFALLSGYARRFFSPGMAELQLVKLPEILYPAYALMKPFRFLYIDRNTNSETDDQHDR